jgi:hypothetical protein
MVSIGGVKHGLANPTDCRWLDTEVRIRNSFRSFQRADRIAEALRSITERKIWEEIAINLGGNAKDIRAELNIIIDRRDKIAHEADMIPNYPGNRWPINESMVNDAVNYIEKIANSIYEVLKQDIITPPSQNTSSP